MVSHITGIHTSNSMHNKLHIHFLDFKVTVVNKDTEYGYLYVVISDFKIHYPQLRGVTERPDLTTATTTKLLPCSTAYK